MEIYKITNKINGKIYIGKDTRNKKNYFGSGIVIKQAIKKYGKENFDKCILCECNNYEELNDKEKHYIIFYNSIGRSYGGDGFSGITQETIDKIVLKNTGKKRTDESRKKMSDASKNKPKSEVHKKSLSKAWDKRKIEHPHTEETLKKMKSSMIGKNLGKYVKIYLFKGPDGREYETKEGIVKFSRKQKISINTFKDLIKNENKEYKGWKYIKTIKI